MKQILTLTFLLFALCAPAKIVKKNVPSHKMNRSIPCVIILPDNYDKKAAYPVIYLLHGYGGDQNSWITIKPALNDIATRDSLIFVCPDHNLKHLFPKNLPPISTNTMQLATIAKVAP